MLIGITHAVSPNLNACELSFIEREAINCQLALQQQAEYSAALERCGVSVKHLSTNLSDPDSCFVEDTAIVLDELAVITSMGVESRRGETEAMAAELAKYRELVRINLPATIEGGDCLRVGRKIFVGQSGRTNARGIEELTRILKPHGYDVIPVRLKESLHLKSGCTAIDEETLIVNPQGLELEPFEKFRLLSVPDGEFNAANTLRVRETLFVQSGFPKTVEMLERYCAKVELLDISEFRKAEAGLTCLSIIFQEPD